MAGDAGAYADRAYAHIHHLAGRIGPRPSPGVGERSAADYAAHVLRRAGLRDVRLAAPAAPGWHLNCCHIAYNEESVCQSTNFAFGRPWATSPAA